MELFPCQYQLLVLIRHWRKGEKQKSSLWHPSLGRLMDLVHKYWIQRLKLFVDVTDKILKTFSLVYEWNSKFPSTNVQVPHPSGAYWMAVHSSTVVTTYHMLYGGERPLRMNRPHAWAENNQTDLHVCWTDNFIAYTCTHTAQHNNKILTSQLQEGCNIEQEVKEEMQCWHSRTGVVIDAHRFCQLLELLLVSIPSSCCSSS